jgi:hypothetical protein
MPLNSTRGASSAKAFGFTAAGAKLLVDYALLAGGGGGGNDCGGGGGAGGYRASFPGGTQFTLAVGTNPITIGAGGTAGSNSYPFSSGSNSSPGVDSTLSNGIITITAAGGGGGGSGNAFPGTPGNAGLAGGSGGGDSSVLASPGATATRAGNTPPVSPPQGNPSSVAPSSYPAPFSLAGGGGGSSAAGSNGNGGNGTSVTSVFGASPQPFYGPTAGVYGGGAGGGGGGPPGQTGGTGGTGGGGAGYNYGEGTNPAKSGVVNSGGGGGGYGQRAIPGLQTAGAGGSGVALIFAPASVAPRVSVSPATNTKTTVPTGAVLRFTVNGNITVT